MNCIRGYLHLRHDTIRDHLAAYARTCGLLAEVEQCVAQGETVEQGEGANQAARAARPLHRADVHIAGATVGDVWLDVRVSYAPQARRIDTHLRAQEVAKRKEYGYTEIRSLSGYTEACAPSSCRP